MIQEPSSVQLSLLHLGNARGLTFSPRAAACPVLRCLDTFCQAQRQQQAAHPGSQPLPRHLQQNRPRRVCVLAAAASPYAGSQQHAVANHGVAGAPARAAATQSDVVQH